jgi:hypothetical protein
MNGQLKENELNFLIGAVLAQVCVGKYGVILNFEEEVSISVESSLSINQPEPKLDQLWSPGGTFVCNGVFDFIGNPISEFQIFPDGGLSLRFGNLGTVSIGINIEYESYQICNGSELWVV